MYSVIATLTPLQAPPLLLFAQDAPPDPILIQQVFLIHTLQFNCTNAIGSQQRHRYKKMEMVAADRNP